MGLWQSFAATVAVETAVFASGDVHVAEAYGAAALLVESGRRWSRGARRVFR